jgi:hypothetical protein
MESNGQEVIQVQEFEPVWCETPATTFETTLVIDYQAVYSVGRKNYGKLHHVTRDHPNYEYFEQQHDR